MKKDEIFTKIDEINNTDLNTFRENLWNNKYKKEILLFISNDKDAVYIRESLKIIDTNAYLANKNSSSARISAVVAVISAIISIIGGVISIFK